MSVVSPYSSSPSPEPAVSRRRAEPEAGREAASFSLPEPPAERPAAKPDEPPEKPATAAKSQPDAKPEPIAAGPAGDAAKPLVAVAAGTALPAEPSIAPPVTEFGLIASFVGNTTGEPVVEGEEKSAAGETVPLETGLPGIAVEPLIVSPTPASLPAPVVPAPALLIGLPFAPEGVPTPPPSATDDAPAAAAIIANVGQSASVSLAAPALLAASAGALPADAAKAAPATATVANEAKAGPPELLSDLIGKDAVVKDAGVAAPSAPAEFKLAEITQHNQAPIDLSALVQSRAAKAEPAALPAGSDVQAQSSAQGADGGGQPTPLHVVPIEIGLRALAGSKRFDIRLDPAELGRVDVNLEISERGEVSAKLVVDRVETLQLLQRDARTLERAFEQAGLKPSDGGVEISLRDPSDQPGFRQNGQNEGQPRRGRSQAQAEDDAILQAQAAPTRRLVRLGGVDLSI